MPLVTGRIKAYDKGGNREKIQLSERESGRGENVNNEEGKYTVNRMVAHRTFVY